MPLQIAYLLPASRISEDTNFPKHPSLHRRENRPYISNHRRSADPPIHRPTSTANDTRAQPKPTNKTAMHTYRYWGLLTLPAAFTPRLARFQIPSDNA